MQSISEFYAGRSVLITGASGFIGKQLVEKLLRSCPDIDKIYLLLRSTRFHDPPARLQYILSSPVCRPLSVSLSRSIFSNSVAIYLCLSADFRRCSGRATGCPPGEAYPQI